MRRIFFTLLALALPVAAFAQLDDDTITVTASRTSNLQPDELSVGVSVNAPATSTLDDVVAVLSGTGITARNLASTSNVQTFYPQPQLSAQWNFTTTVPIAKASGLLATLAKLVQAPAMPGTTGVSFYVQGTQVSAALQAANPCAYTTLVSDAQRQAQALAAAAGVAIGRFSPSPTAVPGGRWLLQYLDPTTSARQGDFSALLGVVSVTGALSATSGTRRPQRPPAP